MARKYWLDEQPEVVTSARNVLRFYQRAGRLQVAKPDWEGDAGEQRMGKAVTLDLAALQEAEPEELQKAAALFEKLAGDLRQAAEVAGVGGSA